jgi:para-aminobenzoate synthetase component 1
MKAIEEIEDYRRGVYSGAIGYFTPENDFDFSVVIRTALIKSNKLVYPVGGAITADSIPEQEWEETLLKAKALTNISD